MNNSYNETVSVDDESHITHTAATSTTTDAVSTASVGNVFNVQTRATTHTDSVNTRDDQPLLQDYKDDTTEYVQPISIGTIETTANSYTLDIAQSHAVQNNDESFDGDEYGVVTQPSLPSGNPTVTCRVCEHVISYEIKPTQHVVRCSSCGEATPLRAPPTGKKFVRCSCNCLMICKISSNRIACPRATCGRVIILKPTTPANTNFSAPTGTARLQCCHCDEVFMHNTLSTSIATCPHCLKKSSTSIGQVRSRTIGYFVSAVVLFALISGLTFGTNGSRNWVIVVDSILFLVILFFLERSYFNFRLKASKILGPV